MAWPFSLYDSGPSDSFNAAPAGGGGGWDWGRILGGGMGLFGTGMGIYSQIDAGRRQQQAVDFARRQADAYARDAAAYQTGQNQWRNQMAQLMQGYLGQAIGAMNAPIQSSYAPMSDAAAKARRRGITAQAALRTGGNEGGYVDDQVAEGMAKDELQRYEASTRLDAMLNQNRMATWPAILSAIASMMGAGGPAAPIRPMDVPMPTYSGGGGISAFGDFMKWDAQQKAMERERQANMEFRKRAEEWYTRGQSRAPSVYDPYGVYNPGSYMGYPWGEGENF